MEGVANTVCAVFGIVFLCAIGWSPYCFCWGEVAVKACYYNMTCQMSVDRRLSYHATIVGGGDYTCQ